MRRIVWSLFAVAVLCVGTTAISHAGTVILNPQHVDSDNLPSNPGLAMQSARERVAAGDLDRAVRDLASYVYYHPGEIGPERLLGDLYYRQGQLQKAEATYKHIISYAPLDKETHNRLGSVYATENRIDDAIAEFNRSLPGTDSVPDLVRLHLIKGDFQRYIKEREKAAMDYPSDAEAQLELGQAFEAIHQPDAAIRYFKRALDADPTSIGAVSGLGLSYLDEARLPEATTQFQTCLARDPYNYACMNNLGATYLQGEHWDKASPLLDSAHKLQPERSEALVNLGYLADSRGDWKRAIVYYIDAMTVYPYSPDAYIDLGYTYNMHSLYKLAQQALIKGLAVAPQDGRLHYLLGEAYHRQGNDALARVQFKAAAGAEDLDPDVKRLAQQRIATLDREQSAPVPHR
jgi:tetratricopeptide (TPR) repeat protein